MLNHIKSQLVLSVLLFLACATTGYAQEHVKWNIKGQEAYKKGQLDSAILAFTKSTSIEPGYEKAHFNLAMAHFKQKDYSNALNSFNTVLTLNTSNALSSYYKSFCLYYLKDFEQALSSFDQTITLMPKKKELYFYAASICNLSGNKEQEITYHDRLLKVYPNDYKSLMARAHLQNDLQHFDLALKDLDLAITADPSAAEPLLLRGIIRINHGDIDTGCIDLRKAKEFGENSKNLEDLLQQYCTASE